MVVMNWRIYWPAATLVIMIALATPAYASHDSCSIDIIDIDVDGDVIEARIKNTGSESTSVEARFFEDGEFLDKESERLSAGETETFELRHRFTRGSTDIIVEAKAGCGDTDDEGITHVVLDREGREDRDDEDDDFRIDFERERLDFEEPEACGVDIEGVDFTTRSFAGEPATLSADVENTGNTKQAVDIILYLDGAVKEVFRKELFSREAYRHTFRVFPEAGSHRIAVVAESACGVSDMLIKDFEVLSDKLAIISLQGPEEEREPAETAVTFHPTHLDAEAGEGKAVKITIETAVPQNFVLSHEGIPSDWISLEPKVFVSRKKDLFVLVTPKNLGLKEFNLFAKAEAEGTTFGKKIILYGSLPAAEGEKEQESIFDLFNTATGKAIVLITIVIILVIAGIAYFKKYNVQTGVSEEGAEPRKPSERLRKIREQMAGLKKRQAEAAVKQKAEGVARQRYSETLRRIKEQIRR